ncbi:GSCOCG00000001001-RA-CDS [Cotesia congregata]|uniref:Similar to SPBC1773.06c: Zinc-type alcohol dehydrogenase-like protein C1773.06c (Schizosaccharomyces pombe (Strain 972 / ATCC 24843)) n=1 Tax=Cotesia congregata TaxID=51543 RepID=A0A8J2HLN9_COTCN|nr:GSCOCG00000001001-RA-CDS [Cotesia congregata]CAG5100921.1 Similar to SPBC1773.06c: Zinc-type alcohol dehydrogenase-like protein C1773.06c (Schizosaccharomyces pombe (strain 972 / ATCC 24843)) [Cotesia congregata]
MPVEIESINSTHIASNSETKKMNKLCRQLSIESPSVTGRDCVFSFDVPVPDVPIKGARIRVVCAGACYHPRRSPSLGSLTSVSSASSLATESSVECDFPMILPHYGVRDAALFPGYEVAGIIESLGSGVTDDCNFVVGDRVILYPFEGIPNGYVEYLVVHDLKYLIKIPENMSLSIAAMLPAGALLAMNTVFAAHEHVQQLLKERAEDQVCKILIVGTGGLALWTLRIAAYYFSNMQNKVTITVASLRDDGLLMAQEFQQVNVVEWNEGLYEKQLIERTMDACQGQVDVVIDYGTTSRSLHRSLQCLGKGGVVFVIKEVADRLLPKFSKRVDERQQNIKSIEPGSLDQLSELVQLVASGKIEPPPHTVYPAEQAMDVVHKLCHSEIQGRAILRFHPTD